MSYVTWEIKHIPFNNGWNSNDEVTLTSYQDPILQVALGDSRDSFSFKVTNFNTEFDDYFNANDKVTISRVLNTETVTTSDVLMVGSIKDAPETTDFQNNMIRVEGWNFSESVMSAIVFVDLEGKTIPAGLQEALENVGTYSSNFAVTWNSNNPSLNSEGSAFPIIGSEGRFFNKRLKEIIEKYTTNQKTEDGDYYWYVNNNNEFIWRRQEGNIDHEFNTSTGTHKKIKIGKDIKDIRNFIIVKGGFDPENNQIQRKVVDWSSVAKNGSKYYIYVSEKNEVSLLQNLDLNYSYNNQPENNKYPTFPFVTQWTSTYTGTVNYSGGTINVTKGSATTINEGSQDSNEKAYVAILRGEVYERIGVEAQRLLDLWSKGRLEVELEFAAGKKVWGLGSNVNCVIPKIGSLPKVLRVNEIQYTTTSDTFTLKEDEGTL